MKTYAGDRTIDGIVVTVDGVPLDDQTSKHVYSPSGFEWSYEGPEPSQLAFALLVDHLGDDRKGHRASRQIHARSGRQFPNEWEMTSADIEHVLAKF